MFVYSKVESFARCCTAMGEAEDKIVAQVFFVIGASIMLDFFFFNLLNRVLLIEVAVIFQRIHIGRDAGKS